MTDQLNDETVDENTNQQGINRRRMFLAGAGLAGAAVVAKAGSAQALDGGNALIGELNEGDDGATIFHNDNAGATDPGTAGEEAIVGEITGTGNGSHAIRGVTNGTGHSVAGDTPADASNIVAATWGRHGGAGAGIGGESADGYGGEFVGGKAHIRLIQVDNENLAADESAAAGPPTDEAHLIGELYADGAGNLYYNQGTGALFTKLNNQISLLADIQRAYDSREEFTEPANLNKGRHLANEVREIDLTEFTDMTAGASGAIINVTVADTGGNGYALVFNGDTDESAGVPIGSSVNWVGSGQFVANGITVATSTTGTVKVFTLSEAEVIIDVVGYIG